MWRSLLVCGFFLNLHFGEISFAAPPSPPPPPPPTLPEAVEGYDVGKMWNQYGGALRASVPIAREKLFAALSNVMSVDNFEQDIEIIQRHVLIRHRGEFYEGNSIIAVETICEVFSEKPRECYLRLRGVGYLSLESSGAFLPDNFDPQIAASYLEQNSISPDDFNTKWITLDDPLMGLPDAVDARFKQLNFYVISEYDCEPLRVETAKLLEKVETMSIRYNKIPWPHTGFVDVVISKQSAYGVSPQIYDLAGYNDSPVVLERDKFLSNLRPCFEKQVTLEALGLDDIPSDSTPR